MQKQISNWGNYPKITANEYSFSWENEAIEIVKNTPFLIARGNGRCYGDSSLSENILSSLKHNKILHFDEVTGILTCQSGILLEEILKNFVPKGWFLPVVPGTKFITIGGAIASDIHGKNHHSEGSFSKHVISLQLLLNDGQIITCSNTENADYFRFTMGGMGLTGVIVNATIQLKKIETSFIKQETIKAKSLQHIFDIFEQSENYTYTVAWIDCMATGKNLGKSIMMRGEHAKINDLKPFQKEHPLQSLSKPKLNIPFYLPTFVLNKWSIKAFNQLFYSSFPNNPNTSIIHYEPYFFPLDSILNWNRMYGKNGFVQYQLVFPLNSSKEGLTLILKTIERYGFGSFLAVLKLFGEQNDTNISFPMRGYTLTLDFPVNDIVFKLLNELDSIVLDFGGRIYLTKDARMKVGIFEKNYPHLIEFKDFIKKSNLKFASNQAKRLNIIS